MNLRIMLMMISIFHVAAPAVYGVELNELLEKARGCTQSEECIITTELACPLHCYVAVNKNVDLTELLAYVNEIRSAIVCESCIKEDVIAMCENDLCVKSERQDNE